MGSLFLSELGLDSKISSKPISPSLARFSKIHCVSKKIFMLQDYVNRMQDEMKKIDGFKRELPICIERLTDEISAAEEMLAQCRKLNPVPVLEEFIPLNKTCTEEKDDKSQDSKREDNSIKDKIKWMSSVQLWNADDNSNRQNADFSDKPPLKVESNKKGKEEELNRPVMDNLFQSGKNREAERAFVTLKGCSSFPVMAVGKEYMDESPVPGLSLCTPGIKNSREGIKHVGFSLKSSYSRTSLSSAANIQSNFKAAQQQTGRKQRRCWSVELHRQFMNALDHLGGHKVATPKQIREHMQVTGLTNDEVKSHLQKYRLHIERAKSNSNSQTAGFWADSTKFLMPRKSKSDSPDGPLQLSEGNDVDDDDEDAKSESIQG